MDNLDKKVHRLEFPLSYRGVNIREFNTDDFEKIHQYCSDPLVSEFQAWGPNTLEQSRQFHQLTLSEQTHSQRKAYNFAISCDGLGVVGGAGIFLENDNAANIGLSLHSSAWGKSFGAKAIKLLIFFCRNELKLSKLIATADINNHRSVNLFKKLGFIHKTTIEKERQVRGRWRTTVFLELPLTSTSGFLAKLDSLTEIQLSDVIKKCSPVSLIQKNILIHNTLLAEKSSYNLGWAWKISNNISVLSVESAFHQLLHKHSILRCLVVQSKTDGDRLLKMPSSVARINCPALQKDSNHAKNLMRANYSTPFILDTEIPIRCFLIQTDSELFLQVLIHHAFIDGAGVAILKNDFSNLLLNPEGSAILPEDQSYFSYIRQENSEQDSDQIQNDLLFWNQYYSDFNPTLPFSADTMQVSQAKTLSHSVDAETLQSVYQATTQLNIVEFPIFQLALSIAMAQEFQILSFNIGTTVQLRDNELFSKSIGPLINTLKLKGDLDLNKSIKQLLVDLNNEYLEVLSHQKIPYISLLEKIKSCAAKEPFQVVLEFQRLFKHQNKNEFLEIEVGQRSSKFPLNLFVFHNDDDKVDLTLEFDSKIVSNSSAESFLQKFYQALKTIALAWKADTAISEALNFEASSIAGATITDCESIAHKITALQHRDDIILQDSNHSFSGKQVFKYAYDFSRQIIEKYADQDVIALEEERTSKFICNLLGIWLAGKSFHILSKNIPATLKQSLLSASSAQLLNAEPDSKLQKASGIPGYIMFSSGTTGNQKGVKIHEPAILNLLLGLRNLLSPFSPKSCLLNASFSFDASIQQLLLFLDGARLVVLSDYERLDFAQWPKLIEQFQIDLIDCTPTQAKELMTAGIFSEDSKLKAALIGGEKIDSRLLSNLAHSHVKSFNVYGPCECTVDVTGTLITKTLKVGELGSPFPNTKIEIVDKRNRILPIGFLGEIRIGGNQVCLGYLDGRDSAKFQNQSYLTGDLGFIDDNGSLHYVGRRDLQIKRAGVRIELDGITAVSNRHHLIQDSHAHFEHETKKLYLVVKIKDSNELDASAVRLFLKEVLPSYAMPDLIIVATNIPRNHSGKIDWNDLIKKEITERQSSETIMNSETEEAVALIWSKELNRDSIDNETNFFDVGGDSLAVFKTMMNIRSHFKVPFSVADFMENPTIKLIAKKIESLKLSKFNDENYVQAKILSSPKNNNSSILVLFHPVGGNLASYHSLIKSLKFNGTIVGISSSENTASTQLLNISDYVQKIYASLYELVGNKPCHLMGWSFGGMLALEFEKKYRAKLPLMGLILIDTHLNSTKKINLEPADILRSAVYPFLKNKKISENIFSKISADANAQGSDFYLKTFKKLQKFYAELSDIDGEEFLKLVEKIKYFRSLAPTFDFNTGEIDTDTYIFNADQDIHHSSSRINIRSNSSHKTVVEIIAGDHFSIMESSVLSQKINSVLEKIT